MKVSQNTEKQYPKATACLKSLAPQVESDFKVHRALFSNSGVSRQILKNALSWGSLPLVTPEILSLKFCGETNLETRPNEILVNRIIFSQYEWHQDRSYIESLFKTTVLHELVHWLRGKGDINKFIEWGQKFESEVFGYYPGCKIKP